MIQPEILWVAILGAVAAGLAYYRFVIQPELFGHRMRSTVRAFGRAVELRFPNHSGLTEVICRFAQRVGIRMGLGPRRISELQLAIRLRDIGLCAIPYRLVNRRAWEDWTLSETATYDCHAEIGGAILESIPALGPYAEIVRNHHAVFERIGYRMPSVEARIVKACAEYVWYARHRGRKAAILHLEEGMGSLYDPTVAREVLRASPPANTSFNPSHKLRGTIEGR